MKQTDYGKRTFNVKDNNRGGRSVDLDKSKMRAQEDIEEAAYNTKLVESMIAVTRGGPKDGTEYVSDANRLLTKMDQDGVLNDTSMRLLIEHWKGYPLTSKADVLKNVQDGLKKREESLASIKDQDAAARLRKAYDSSIPSQKRLADSGPFSELVEQFHKYVQKMRLDPRCVTWSSFALTLVFQAYLDATTPGLIVYAKPSHPQLLQNALVCAKLTVDEFVDSALTRFKLLVNLCNKLEEKKMITLIQKRTAIPGTDKLSTNGQYALTDSGVKFIQESGEPAVIEDERLDNITSSSKPALVLSAVFVQDFRAALQCSEIKVPKGRGQPLKTYSAPLRKVADAMKEVINSIDKKGWQTTRVDLDSHTEFSDRYYTCLGFWRATVRGFNRQLYGIAGTGPDTRTGRLMVDFE
jgi:hypothetical protein